MPPKRKPVFEKREYLLRALKDNDNSPSKLAIFLGCTKENVHHWMKHFEIEGTRKYN